MKAPCMSCQDRHATCHTDCNAYLQYRAMLDKVAQAENNTFWIDYHYASMSRMKRKKNKRLLDKEWS